MESARLWVFKSVTNRQNGDLMYYIIGFFLTLAINGCLSAHLERDQGDIKTIGYYTGTLSNNEGVYLSRFEQGAEKACQGKKYTVLEKTRSPSTMSGMDLPSSKFYWVVRCEK